MKVEKIYRSLTTKEYGVYQGTTVDEVDGKIRHTLLVDGEERVVMDSTFRRWWKWVEETTPEDLPESLELLEKVKDTVLTQQPTIEDLKQLNESGEELTEEELQLFKEQAQLVAQVKDEIEKATPVVYELPSTEEKKPVVRKSEKPQIAEYFLSQVEAKGGEWHIYTEGREGIVKSGGRGVLFFGFVKQGIRIYMKEQLDEATIPCPYPVEEKQTYPKQYPFRVLVPELNEQSEQLLNQILDLYI